MIKICTLAVWISFICVILPASAYGQKNFVPGYLVFPQGDTIRGLVDDQNWARNPRIINFKLESNSKIQHYSASQLAECNIINGDSYRLGIVQVDKTPTKFEELLRVTEPNFVQDTVLLLEEVKGDVKLYHLLDENQKNHFYIQVDRGPITELIQRNYVARKNGQQVLGTYNQYKDQLRYTYLVGCPSMEAEIASTAYTKIALKNLIYNYNNCINPNALVENKPVGKEKLLISLVAGMNATSYEFKGESYSYHDLINAKFDFKSNVMAGVAFQILLPRNRNKISIYNELALKKNYSKGQSLYDIYYQKVQTDITIKASYIGATSMLRYSWINPVWQPFINVGFALNHALQIETLSKHTVTSTSGTETNKEGRILEDVRKQEVAAVAGLGIKVNKISAELRMEHGTGYLNYMKLSISKSMAAFLVSYNFN